MTGAHHGRSHSRRHKSRRWSSTALALAVSLWGCGPEDPASLRVSSKEFTESTLLAEILAQLAERAGIPVERQIPLAGSFPIFEAIKDGHTDLYAEYTGTVLTLAGRSPLSDPTESVAEVQTIVEPLGLGYGPGFGFSNDYAVVMRRDIALAHDITAISDLVMLRGGVRFAADEPYLRRPIDGLTALARRYGFVVRETLRVPADERGQVLQALLDGKADAGEAYSTDQQLDHYGLVVLEDDLGFFPDYEPAPLVRRDALARFPELSPVLEAVADSISEEEMREMVRQIEVEAKPLESVARAFMSGKGKGEPAPSTARAQAKRLTIAVGPLADLGALPLAALRAVRRTMPKREVVVRTSPDPLAETLAGRARLAVASADAFYEANAEGAPVARKGSEALGVLGYRLGHLLVPQASRRTLGEVRRLGVGPATGTSHRVATWLLQALGRADKVSVQTSDDIEAQLAQLAAGKLNAVFLMVHLGHGSVREALRSGTLKLVPIVREGTRLPILNTPFLRLARVPANSYDGQEGAVETVSAQVVLAGPSQRRDTQLGEVGPGYVPGVGPSPLLPVSDEAARKIAAELRSERVDPVIPVAAAIEPTAHEAKGVFKPAPLASATNVVAIAFVAYLIYLFLRRDPEEESDGGDGEKEEKEVSGITT